MYESCMWSRTPFLNLHCGTAWLCIQWVTTDQMKVLIGGLDMESTFDCFVSVWRQNLVILKRRDWITLNNLDFRDLCRWSKYYLMWYKIPPEARKKTEDEVHHSWKVQNLCKIWNCWSWLRININIQKWQHNVEITQKIMIQCISRKCYIFRVFWKDSGRKRDWCVFALLS